MDFTRSIGARLPALTEFAEHQNVPFAGNDGKTGETLVKSVLAPMFALRSLRVQSWSGVNLLGGGDGASLTEPPRSAAKVASKQRIVGDVLGYQPSGDSRIDYVEPLGDFKTAWDLITLTGFLGTRMRLDFTRQGCDSALAAPLVLDPARLTAAAHGSNASAARPAFTVKTMSPGGVGMQLWTVSLPRANWAHRRAGHHEEIPRRLRQHGIELPTGVVPALRHHPHRFGQFTSVRRHC